jgi:hypothetical protein
LPTLLDSISNLFASCVPAQCLASFHIPFIVLPTLFIYLVGPYMSPSVCALECIIEYCVICVLLASSFIMAWCNLHIYLIVLVHGQSGVGAISITLHPECNVVYTHGHIPLY